MEPASLHQDAPANVPHTGMETGSRFSERRQRRVIRLEGRSRRKQKSDWRSGNESDPAKAGSEAAGQNAGEQRSGIENREDELRKEMIANSAVRRNQR